MDRNHVNNKDIGVKPWPMFKIVFWGPYGDLTKFIRASDEAMARVIVKSRNKVWQIHSLTEIPVSDKIYRGTYEEGPGTPAWILKATDKVIGLEREPADTSAAPGSKLDEIGG